MLIFLENLAGGTLIRVGSLIRHCIVIAKFLVNSEFLLCQMQLLAGHVVTIAATRLRKLVVCKRFGIYLVGLL